MKAFIKRNLLLFFRDRAGVFFSLLAVFIIIALYLVFLGNSLNDTVQRMGVDGAQVLMGSWLAAGLLAVASMTATMGALGVMVEDKVKKIHKDFYSSPLSRKAITGGYLGSAFIIGVIVSLAVAALAEVYIVSIGGAWLGPAQLAMVFLAVLLATATNTSIVCFIVSFFKSQSAYGAASTIIGTLVGFLTGIYLPVGDLPAPVQMAVKLFPVSHAASLFRQTLMRAPMQDVFSSIGGPAAASYMAEFKEYMGVTFTVGGSEMTAAANALVLAATAAVFYALALANLSRKSA
jgi:multidrug/hemolysin transport system permease protein